jgi:hypothetical protein
MGPSFNRLRCEVVVERASAEAYVIELYRELVARAPSGSEHEGWIGRLLKGAPPSAVREAIGQLREAADEQRISAERQVVERSGLFDASWYLRTNRDVADAGTDPLDHYIRHGRQEGRAANAYLVNRWYRKRTRIRRGTDALRHYASKGEPAGHSPGPNFNPVWYREVYQLADGVSPLAHFLGTGRRSAWRPDRRCGQLPTPRPRPRVVIRSCHILRGTRISRRRQPPISRCWPVPG